jgi:dipeptidyl aminopeptidase/acylaminoacyl peptidase
MPRLLIVVALLLSCTAPVTTPSQTPGRETTPLSLPSATLPSSPSLAFRDLKVTAAGDVRSDHVLASNLIASTTAGVPSQTRLWDVPLDGSAPRLLVAYTRGSQMFTDYDRLDLTRQLSRDGRRLVLSDPQDAAGSGLIVVDLVAGIARRIAIGEAADQPAWSPDGQRIAYRGFTISGPFQNLQKESGIWVTPSSGGTPQQVWTSDLDAGSGATTVFGWTEDGSGIAIGRGSAKASLVEVATGKITDVGAVRAFAWRAKRPAVTLIVEDQIASPRSAPAGHVEVRDTTLASPTTVARYGPDDGTFFIGATWSPTSDDILVSYACGQGVRCRDELVIVDAASAARRVVSTATTPRAAAWSGNGDRIVYTDLFAMRTLKADGSDDRELFRPAPAGAGANSFLTAMIPFVPR